MPAINDFELTVLVNNSPLREYAVDDDADADADDSPVVPSNTITKYIEAAAGFNFSLTLNVKPSYKFEQVDCLCWDIYLDGVYVQGTIINEKRYTDSKGFRGYNSTQIGSIRGSGDAWVVRKFTFGDILTRDTTANDSFEKYSNLGQIWVKVWRYSGAPSDDCALREVSQPVEEVPEKAIKGLAVSLTAKLGETEKTRQPKIDHGTRIGNDPIATFILKYRSKKALQQLMILPRSPSPLPLEDRPIDELSIDETRELLRLQKAATEAMKARVKKEQSQNNLNTLRGLKRERSKEDGSDDELEVLGETTSRKTRHNSPIEVIDLLD